MTEETTGSTDPDTKSADAPQDTDIQTAEETEAAPAPVTEADPVPEKDSVTDAESGTAAAEVTEPQAMTMEELLKELEEEEDDGVDAAEKYGLDCTRRKRNRFAYWLYRFIKRFLDILCSGLFMIVFCWLYAILAICVKCSSKGHVVYRQKRVCKGGREFYIPKFRSMYEGADKVMFTLTEEERRQYRQEYKLTNDPRITKVGRFLRKSSMDELPNLWSIFIGRMSIVGPRPILKVELDRKYGSAGAKLTSVRPGLIGWWSCNGRSLIRYDEGERQKLELYYVDHCSLWMDIKIFFKQIGKVIRHVGAS
ncbi:MAG: sugar transferase [Clostridia bacterium]|nr:sugar transferase [Clostridia bacterium]